MVARSKVHDGRDSCGEVGPAPGAEAMPAVYKPHVRPHFIVTIASNHHCERNLMMYLVADMPKRFVHAGTHNPLKCRLRLTRRCIQGS